MQQPVRVHDGREHVKQVRGGGDDPADHRDVQRGVAITSPTNPTGQQVLVVGGQLVHGDRHAEYSPGASGGHHGRRHIGVT